MSDRRSTRRRVLRAVVGIGLAVGMGGCAGTDSASERDTSTQPTSGQTTALTTVTTASEPSTTGASAGRATASEETSADDATTVSGETSTTASEATRGAYTVGMHTELYFDPIGLYVEPGETVSFELISGVHSAAAYHPKNEAAFERRVPEGAPAWNTGVFDERGEFRNVTFEVSGTYDYFCLPHKQLGMVGRIVVGEPGGPATKSTNPDGDLPDSERIVEKGSVSYEEFQASGQ